MGHITSLVSSKKSPASLPCKERDHGVGLKESHSAKLVATRHAMARLMADLRALKEGLDEGLLTHLGRDGSRFPGAITSCCFSKASTVSSIHDTSTVLLPCAVSPEFTCISGKTMLSYGPCFARTDATILTRATVLSPHVKLS